jgi:hypothetical protein
MSGFAIPQSTSFVAVFKAFLATDHATEATGKTIAITISKAGGAFGNPNAGATNATEISSGWYKVTLDTTDTATLGVLAVRGAVATIDDVGLIYYVVKATNGGMTALPDTAVTTNASLFTSGTGTAQLSATSGVVLANTTQFAGSAVTSAAGIPEVKVASIANNAITANSINANAITDAKVDSDVTIASVTGAVGSVTGAVGSVTGAVGSVTGAVGSVTATVDANIVEVNSVAVTGTGAEGDEWGP